MRRGNYGPPRNLGPGDLGLRELAAMERAQEETDAGEGAQQIPPEEIYDGENDEDGPCTTSHQL